METTCFFTLSLKWEDHDEEFVAHCATNVALSKPAEASSEVGAGTAAKAVDGRRSTVHEGSKVGPHVYKSLTRVKKDTKAFSNEWLEGI